MRRHKLRDLRENRSPAAAETPPSSCRPQYQHCPNDQSPSPIKVPGHAYLPGSSDGTHAARSELLPRGSRATPPLCANLLTLMTSPDHCLALDWRVQALIAVQYRE